MQLDKILQSQGFGSRKYSRLLINKGLVEINQTLCKDAKADFNTEGLEFCVDGETYHYREKVYITLHKPSGYECSNAPQHHASVFSLLPAQLIARGVQCVGRLDQDTTGLLLFTDDGQCLHALTHPRRHVSKHYRVITKQAITDSEIEQLLNGVLLNGEEQTIAADTCIKIDDYTLELSIHQGIYHQVKRMLAAAGNSVAKLHRFAIGDYQLSDDLAPKQWHYLTEQELAQIQK